MFSPKVLLIMGFSVESAVKRPTTEPAELTSNKAPSYLTPLKWLIGSVILALTLWVIDVQIGFRQTFAHWRSFPVDQLIYAFMVFALSHLIRAYRIYDLTLRNSNVAFLPVAKLSAIHQFANNLLPMRLGEAVFPWLMKKHFNISWQQGFAKLLWLRVLDLIIMGSVVLLVIFIKSPWLAMAAITLGVSSLILIFMLRRPLLKFKWLKKLFNTLRTSAPQSKAQAARLLLWTIMAWFCKLSALVIVIRAVIEVPFATALAGLAGAELSGILPIHGVGGAGTFEAAFWAGASLAGQASKELLALAVNLLGDWLRDALNPRLR